MALPTANKIAAEADIADRWKCYQDDTDVDDSVTEHVLCSRCRALSVALMKRSHVEPKTFAPQRSFLLTTISELEANYLSGCHLCAILWQTIRYTRSRIQMRIESSKERTYDVGDTTVEFATQELSTEPGRMCTITHIRLGNINNNTIVGSNVLLLWERNGRDLRDKVSALSSSNPLNEPHPAQAATTTASQATLKLANKWLDECFQSHPSCSRVSDSFAWQVPRRFLHVSKDGIRIRNSTDFGPRPKYFALSHCWGLKPIIRLLSISIDQYYEKVDFAALSKTFQDAVIVTRKLGFSLLWIDSLCIIQDSPEDWARESAIMGDVYRNSVLTISALSARDGSEGCFVRRNPLCYRPCRIGEDGEATVYIHGGGLPTREWGDLSAGGVAVEVGTLHTRAWVFQERVLSPRTLHFGRRSIAWQCLEQEATEPEPKGTFGSGQDPYAIRRHKRDFWMLENLRLNGIIEPEDLERFRAQWIRLRRAYTSTFITYSKDRLTAMQGLISTIQTRTGLRSVAGLWKEILREDLLWYSSARPEIPRSTLRKPTWSWICFDGTVDALYIENTIQEPGRALIAIGEFQDLTFQPRWICEVVDVYVDDILVDGKPTGQIREANLVLRGRSRRIDLELLSAMCFTSSERMKFDCHLNDSAFFSPPEDPHAEVIVLPMLIFEGCLAKPEARYEFGLVLEKVHETGMDTWMRIGSYKKRYEVGDMGLFFEHALGNERGFFIT